MPKTITLRVDDKKYELIKAFASKDNRTLSNFIETATLNYISEENFCDDMEMAEILNNEDLLKNLQEGSKDARERKGRFV